MKWPYQWAIPIGDDRRYLEKLQQFVHHLVRVDIEVSLCNMFNRN